MTDTPTFLAPLQTVPDLLSHVHDYRRNVSGNELTPLPTSCVILDQKDIL